MLSLASIADRIARRAPKNVPAAITATPAPDGVVTRQKKGLATRLFWMLSILLLVIAVRASLVGGIKIVTGDGPSMEPTLKDGGVELFSPLIWWWVPKDKIYLFVDPEGILSIKRMTDRKGEYCFMRGDNKTRDDIEDSRTYGWIPVSRLRGIHLMTLPLKGLSSSEYAEKKAWVQDPALQAKKSSFPTAYWSDHQRDEYTWLSQQRPVFKLRFTVMGSRKDYFVDTKNGKVAMLYYFGQPAVVRMGDRSVELPVTDSVTALIIDDVSKVDQINIESIGEECTFFRIWIYDTPLKSRKGT